MTETEKQIAEAEKDVAEKGPDSQTEKDRIDESVGEQEHLDGNKDSQSAKDRVEESEDAKKADEERNEKKDNSGLESKFDALISRMDKLIASFEKRAEEKDDKMARAAEKYGFASSESGEGTRKEFTTKDVERLLNNK